MIELLHNVVSDPKIYYLSFKGNCSFQLKELQKIDKN